MRPGKVCSLDGICWERPLPQGNDLLGVHVVNDHDAWAVGNGTTLLHWDGAAWSGVTGLAESHVVASGGQHYDAKFLDVWASSATDVWVVGSVEAQPVVLHGDGSEWRFVPIGATGESAQAVYGIAPDDVWIMAGVDGWHWDGKALARYPIGASGAWDRAIWGAAKDEIYVAGLDGIHRWNGAAWLRESTRPGTAVWGTGPGEVWAVGYSGVVQRKISGQWIPLVTTIASSEMLTGVWGKAPNDVWALSGDSAFHFDGGSWAQSSIPLGFAIHGSGNTGFVVGEAGNISAVRAQTIEQVGGAARPEDTVTAIHGVGSTVWFAGARIDDSRYTGGLIYRYTGSAFSDYTVSQDLGSIWAFDANTVWAGSFASTFRSQGASFVSAPELGRGRIFALSPTDAWWGVGDDYQTLHYDGKTLVNVTNPVRGLNGAFPDMFGLASDAIRATTRRNTIIRWDGKQWNSEPATGPTYAVWAADPDSWLATGTKGCILRWDGALWKEAECPASEALTAIRGSARDDIWALEPGKQHLLHFDGKDWSTLRIGTAETLTSLYVSNRDIWVAGLRDSILRLSRPMR